MTELTQWFGEHQQWIMLAIALLAFFESLALVGIIIPGVALLFATAVAAGSASINIWWVLIAGFLGAVLGDGLSFLLGRHSHEKITQLPPFNKHPEWIIKGEEFFQKYGIASIVIGRFIGPIRPVMPLVAGMLEMPALRFYSINILSALAWSPFYLLPGYLIGAAAETQQLVKQQHFFLLACILFIPWITNACLTLYQKRPSNNKQRLNTSIILFATSSALLLCTYLMTKNGHFTSINAWGLKVFTALHLPLLDNFFIAVTLLGYWLPMAIWAATITVFLLLQRHFVLATVWISAALVGQFSISWLKGTTAFVRPSVVQQPPTSFSFPSGHTAIIIVFMGMLLLLSRNRLSLQAYKRGILASTLICVLVACSRLYLGVHWISDIVAGTCLGVMILALFYGILQQKNVQPYTRESTSPKNLLIATVIGIFCAYVFAVIPSFEVNKKHYQLLDPPYKIVLATNKNG
ncbi:hypothetical protein A9Q81_23425 [Gammaproteobacteria bacterium 42_54_T18]|nr:hypothetical protein A9Q81_23425 [Gammaproteobacteria bacterium 42_54_T18]